VKKKVWLYFVCIVMTLGSFHVLFYVQQYIVEGMEEVNKEGEWVLTVNRNGHQEKLRCWFNWRSQPEVNDYVYLSRISFVDDLYTELAVTLMFLSGGLFLGLQIYWDIHEWVIGE
jgi:hypothetical protein